MNNLKFIISFCLILFFLASCGSGNNYTDNSFNLIQTASELSNEYKNFNPTDILSIKFSKPISYTPAETSVQKSSFSNNLIEIENNKLFLLLYDEEPVNGKLYISYDKKELIFIPEDFLNPGDNYTAVITTKLKSIDGEHLKNEIVFSIKTLATSQIASIESPDYAVEDEEINFKLDTSIKISSVLWDFSSANVKEENIKDKIQLAYQYEHSGTYFINVKITDIYGRIYTAEKKINILPNAKKFWLAQNDLTLTNINEVQVENLENNVIKASLKNLSNSLISIVNLDKSTAIISSSESNSESETSKMISITMNPDKINEFKKNLIKNLIDSDRFIGIVSLGGLPSILFYEQEDNGSYKLNILTDDYGMELTDFQYKNYSINVEIPPINPIPLIHNISLYIDNDTLSQFLKYLPQDITEPLPVLYDDNDTLALTFFEPASEVSTSFSISCSWCSKTYNHVKHDIKSTTNKAKKVIHHIVHVVKFMTNIANKRIVDNLKNVKDFFEKFYNLEPLKTFISVKEINEKTRPKIEKIYNEFSKKAKYSFDELTENLFKFIGYANSDLQSGEESIKDIIDSTLDEMYKEKDTLTKAFNYFKEQLEEKTSNLLSTLEDGGIAKQFYFTVDKKKRFYLNILVDNNLTRIPLSTIHKLKNFTDVVSIIGNNYPMQILNFGENFLKTFSLPTIIGFFYTPVHNELKLLGKIYPPDISNFSDSFIKKECNEEGLGRSMCMGFYLSKLRVQAEIREYHFVNTGYLFGFKMDLDPEISDELGYEDGPLSEFFDYITLVARDFPNLYYKFTTKIGDYPIEITGDMVPSILLLATLDLGVNVHYHYVVGGAANVDLGIIVGVDLFQLAKAGRKKVSNVIDKIGKIVGDAHDDALKFFQNDFDSNVGKLVFENGEKLIEFLDKFNENLKSLLESEDLKDITDSLKFRVEIGAGLGVGAGAGGTGTGGGSANGTIGIVAELELNFTTFVDFIDSLRKFGVDTFIITPYSTILTILQAEDYYSFFDNQNFSKMVTLYKDTFIDLIDNVTNSLGTNWDKTLEEFFETLAEEMEVAIFIPEGIKGKVVECVNGSISVKEGPKVAFNGELLFNTIYAITNNKSWVTYLEHPHEYPEITILFPLGGALKTGFEEVIEAGVKLSLVANFFKGKLKIKKDFFLNDLENANNPLVPVSVILKSDKTTIKVGESVHLTCDVITRDNSFSYSTSWGITGGSILSNKILIGNNVVGEISSSSMKYLNIKKFTVPGNYQILCGAGTDQGNNAFSTIDIEVK